MSRVDFERILSDIARAGVYHAPLQDMVDLIAAAKASGFFICRIDLAPVRDRTEFFERLATALEFPAWFGHNWDALADCLGDLSWLPAAGYLVLLENCDGYRTRHSKDFATALQVFAAVAEAWRGEDIPFWVMADMRAEGIATLPEIE